MIGSSSRASSWLTWAQQPREQGGLGLAPHQAAGIVGNLTKESGDDLPSWGPTGDNGTAWGTAQWRNERLGALKQMYPDSYQTVESQQAFMRHELDTTHNKAYQALQSARTPEEAATAFNRLYEVSADNTGGREAAARQLMAQFGGSSDSPGALTSAFAPTESKSRMASPALSADETLGPGVLNTTEKPDNVYEGLMQMAASLSGISNPEQAKALTQQMVAGRKAQGNWSYQVMPNGQLMMSNSQGGVKVMGKPGDYSKDDTYVPIVRTDPMTGQTTYDAMNKNTGEFMSGRQPGSNAQSTQSEQPTTMEDLAAISPLRAKAAQQVLDGAVALPKTGLRGTPEQRQLRNDVLAIGGMDEGKLTARNQAYKNLVNKSGSQLGGQLVQLGHSGDIMAQLGDDAEGLHNSSYRALNALPAMIGDNTPAFQEYAGKASAFDQKADGLVGELSKLYNGTAGGGVTERAIMRQNTPRASDPPEIIASKLQALRDLYESRKNEMEQQVRAPFEGDADKVLEKYMPQTVHSSLSRSAESIQRLHSGEKKAAETPALPKGVKSIQVIQ